MDEIKSGSRFGHVAVRPGGKCCVHYCLGGVLAEKNDARVGSGPTNADSSLNSAQRRHRNIQNNDVRLQFLGREYSFLPVSSLANYLPALLASQQITNCPSYLLMICS